MANFLNMFPGAAANMQNWNGAAAMRMAGLPVTNNGMVGGTPHNLGGPQNSNPSNMMMGNPGPNPV